MKPMKFFKFPEKPISAKMEFMGVNRSETIRRVQQTYCGASQLRHKKFHRRILFEHQVHFQMEMNYFCEWCNKDFPTCSRYQMHMNIHSGIRPFVCQTCGKRFNNLGAKHNHMKMHSSVLPYECPLCQKAFHWELSLKQHLKSHANHRHITDIMVDTIYQKQIEQQKLKKKEEKKRQLMNQIRLKQSSLVNSERVSQPVVKNENSQEAAACSLNTTYPANTPNMASSRSLIHQLQSSAHTIAGLGRKVNMPSMAHHAVQKTAVYNTNTISAGRRNNAIPRPPLPTIVGLGQNGYNTHNHTHPYYGTYKMIKTENSEENQNFGGSRVNMPSVAHQAFQKTAPYNPNTTFAAKRNNAIPRPPLPTIVGLGQNEYNTNNYPHPYYGTYKMIKTENSDENLNFGVNMPSVAHQAFQKTATYNPNATSANKRIPEIPGCAFPEIS
ncbi:Zinc finger protein [Trichinella nelsoni]|uniref:Zinc finger protein n=1 Tax=Trichinella nelsoni TaxID=6336 RepID=A0A0V0RR28_9BILA|nr:Zinc finger protein [Trichinella nelsoni]